MNGKNRPTAVMIIGILVMVYTAFMKTAILQLIVCTTGLGITMVGFVMLVKHSEPVTTATERRNTIWVNCPRKKKGKVSLSKCVGGSYTVRCKHFREAHVTVDAADVGCE